MDGMVLSDGTPSPGLFEWAQVVSPIRLTARRVESAGDEASTGASITVDNRRHSATTADVELRWTVAHDGDVVLTGVLEPSTAPAAPSPPASRSRWPCPTSRSRRPARRG
nr:hypothetical protein GCM10025699_55470 [Microbacterium flavescens]